MCCRSGIACLLFAFGLYAQESKELFSLRYIDLAPGTGAPAAAGKRFTVHYTGWLKDGTKFDSSLEREPFQFVQGRRQVIAGWDAGFEGMKVGGRRKLIIPYQLAYGEQGTGPIPPKAELTFEVELMGVADAAAVVPAIDVLLPFADLETRLLALAGSPRMKEAGYAAILGRVTQLNAAFLKAVQRDSPAIAEADLASTAQPPPSLADSFAAVRKEMETARNGYLGADAELFGKPTTRRGLFTALLVRISEQAGRAEALAVTR